MATIRMMGFAQWLILVRTWFEVCKLGIMGGMGGTSAKTPVRQCMLRPDIFKGNDILQHTLRPSTHQSDTWNHA
jgi:hypothetical protein